MYFGLAVAGSSISTLAAELSKQTLVVFLSLCYLLAVLDRSVLSGCPGVLGAAPAAASSGCSALGTGNAHWDGCTKLA